MPNKDRVYHVTVPKGTHLARSKNTEGAYRGSLLDDETNQICGQAELVEVDRDEDEETEASGDSSGLIDAAIIFGTAILSAGATYAAVRAKPVLEKRWHEKWHPSLQARLHSLRHHKDAKRLELILHSSDFQQTNEAEMSIELFRGANEPQSVMTSEEAQERYIAMLFFLAIAAKHHRELKDARIDNANEQRALQEAYNCVASESVVSLANRVFEANDGLAREANAWLHAFLEDKGSDGGRLVPLEITQVRTMMRLSS